jgi:DNA-binding CsgD family transcriptional regulator
MAGEVESIGADDSLFKEFVRTRRRCRGAIVGISDRTMIVNAGASDLLQPGDRRMLWRWMHSFSQNQVQTQAVFELASGVTVWADCYPALSAGRVVGVVLHLSSSGPTSHLDRIDPPNGALVAGYSRPTVSAVLDPALLTGWSDLTDSERTVAELVGSGLSNRDAGRRLFISRHTVDYHLRRVYRKLGITSRVELARVLGEHYESLSYAVPQQQTA